MDIPQVLTVRLHTVAFVIASGYYGVLGAVIVLLTAAAQLSA